MADSESVKIFRFSLYPWSRATALYTNDISRFSSLISELKKSNFLGRILFIGERADPWTYSIQSKQRTINDFFDGISK